MSCNRCLTSPAARLLKVAIHLLDRRGVPSSKEGIKILHLLKIDLLSLRSDEIHEYASVVVLEVCQII